MDSAGEDLENIFGEHENRENNEDGHDPENIGESNHENSAGVKIQPPKRVVKNPRLKFNPERLIGERGIPVVIDHFKDIKFKGKGHEKEDLDKLLSRLEHWTHRLFPSMKFEDCLHQIEKLGTKRPVQTCVRKIRLDMPILASDFVKDDEEDDVRRNEDTEPIEADAFDQLLGGNFNSNLDTANNFNSNLDTTTNEDMMSFNPSPSYTPPLSSPPESRGQVLGSSTSSLTDEQKEKLERNRKLAVERRKARLAALEQKSELPEESSQSVTRADSIEQSFDSLLANKENKSPDIHEINSQSEIIAEENTSNNLNSDNLGLDDLMDLVDEEAVDTSAVASTSDDNQIDVKLTHKSIENTSVCTNETNYMEITALNVEKTQNCSKRDKILENLAAHNNISSVAEENSQLESPIATVEEGEDDNHNSSSLNHLNNTEEIEAMDCQSDILKVLTNSSGLNKHFIL